MPKIHGDDDRHKLPNMPRVEPLISEPLRMAHVPGEDDPDAQAVELVKELLGDAKTDRERSARLTTTEPAHPLAAALQHWMDAIKTQDIVAAEIAAKEVEAFFAKHSQYLRRPAFEIPFKKLAQAHALAVENWKLLLDLKEKIDS